MKERRGLSWMCSGALRTQSSSTHVYGKKNRKRKLNLYNGAQCRLASPIQDEQLKNVEKNCKVFVSCAEPTKLGIVRLSSRNTILFNQNSKGKIFVLSEIPRSAAQNDPDVFLILFYISECHNCPKLEVDLNFFWISSLWPNPLHWPTVVVLICNLFAKLKKYNKTSILEERVVCKPRNVAALRAAVYKEYLAPTYIP